jgi:uncharacterized damage-inducible protein DinB
MSLNLPIADLLDYSDHERRKWREWLVADPRRLTLTLQPGGRFPTAAALLDHIFLVERRHLARLEGGTPPGATGIPSNDIDGLFDYGRLVRADCRRYLADLDEDSAATAIQVTLSNGATVTMTRRKLATHILLHEIRHLAQLALAARLAGDAPPGDHDLFYCPEVA